MANNKSVDPTKGPMGGVFAFIGGMVGAFYGMAIGGLFLSIIGFIIGVWTGYVVEHVVYRLIILALVVIFILARHAFFHAIFDSTALLEHYPEPAPYIQYKEQEHA